MQSTNPHYVNGGNSAAAAASYPWVNIEGMTEVGWHVSSDSVTGTYVWEVTSLSAELDPNKIAPSAGQIALVILPSAEQTLATPAATVVNHVFTFSIAESTNCSKLPAAKWMRMRSTRSAGGSATGLNIGVTRKGND
jgi:hypothetical protein